jgi:uncharacterized protein (DUF302 family)
MKYFKLGQAAVILAILLAPVTAQAAEPGDFIKTVEGNFEEVFQDIQDEVVNKGLVIDYVGHVDTMLERTAEASGRDQSPYLNARYLQFCSSALTHEAVAADTQNLSMCPYLVFAYETRDKPGTVSVGFREPNLTASEKSQAVAAKVRGLLQGIMDTAVTSN